MISAEERTFLESARDAYTATIYENGTDAEHSTLASFTERYTPETVLRIFSALSEQTARAEKAEWDRAEAQDRLETANRQRIHYRERAEKAQAESAKWERAARRLAKKLAASRSI